MSDDQLERPLKLQTFSFTFETKRPEPMSKSHSDGPPSGPDHYKFLIMSISVPPNQKLPTDFKSCVSKRPRNISSAELQQGHSFLHHPPVAFVLAQAVTFAPAATLLSVLLRTSFPPTNTENLPALKDAEASHLSSSLTAILRGALIILSLPLHPDQFLHTPIPPAVNGNKLLGNVENPEEEEIESLCVLLDMVGQLLDTPKARVHMDVYFTCMKELGKSLNVSSRMQFMLQDVIKRTANGTLSLGIFAALPSLLSNPRDCCTHIKDGEGTISAGADAPRAQGSHAKKFVQPSACV
ncbi:hypothetical protein EDD22DRAFT_959859 [Suillus occidentalis]|nr:hypothetical protein EDD22DRAFT_959859 [Suillus occidentalis]